VDARATDSGQRHPDPIIDRPHAGPREAPATRAA